MNTMGFRERQKLEKLKGIKAAARQLFLEKGFDKATTRKVAEIAGVSHGTVFLYAKEKHDLLFLVLNDDLDCAVEEARLAVDRSSSFIDQLMQFFEPFYRYFSQDSQVALLGIHEYRAAVVGDSPQMRRVSERSKGTLEVICSVIDSCKASGSVDKSVDSQMASSVIRSIYMAKMDSWLRTSELDVEVGMNSLRESLNLLFMGLSTDK